MPVPPCTCTIVWANSSTFPYSKSRIVPAAGAEWISIARQTAVALKSPLLQTYPMPIRERRRLLLWLIVRGSSFQPLWSGLHNPSRRTLGHTPLSFFIRHLPLLNGRFLFTTEPSGFDFWRATFPHVGDVLDTLLLSQQ